MHFSLFFFLTVFSLEVVALNQTASLNVVLFCTNYNEDHVENIDYLNISKIVDVSCPESDQPKDETSETRCSCLQSFNDSVDSLIDWTRTLHMTVAVVALKNFIKNNATTYHGNNEDNSKKDDSRVTDNYFVELPLLFKNDSHLEDQKNRNGDETYPHRTMLNHFLNDQHPSNANLRRRPHTTRVPLVDQKVEYINPASNNSSSTKLQISKLIKEFLSSIGRISNIMSSNVTGYSGQLQKRSFLDATQDTVSNVSRVQKKKGFFLVFYGGELAMLRDPHSDLIQSVKHVMETTNDTLIVITSSCPKFSTNNTRIPVYATGPFAQKLTNSTSLVDVTETLQDILIERNINPRNSELIRDENSVHDDASKYSNTANLILTVFLYFLLN